MMVFSDNISVVSQVNNKQCHTALNGTDECPSCVFEGLNTPVVPELVKTLLLTNDPPGDTILPSLLSTLNAALSMSESVGKCIATTQAVLEKMLRLQGACTLSIKQHKAAIHPLRSIPDDILCAIFKRHIASELGQRGSVHDTPSSSYSPWTLSRVCRRWRGLVISSPQLWSTIDVVPNDERYRGFMVARQALALQRSVDCVLSICIKEDSIYRNQRLVEQGIHLLLPTTGRWKYLELFTSVELLAPLTACSFDRLTELVWTLPFPFHPDPKTVSMFKSARNLRRLTLRDSTNRNIDLPWDRITAYSTDVYGISSLPKLMAAEFLKLSFFLYVDEDAVWRTFQATMTASLTLPSLRSLSMTHAAGTLPFMLHVSRLLFLPSLTTLSIVSPKVPLPEFPGPLPHLRHITLESYAPPAEIHTFLARYPSVTSLYTMNMIVVHLLGLHPTLLPNLGILRIEAIALISYPLRVIEVLEERCESEVPLVELRISGKETALERARASILKIKGLGERWDTVCGRLRVLDADEMGDESDF